MGARAHVCMVLDLPPTQCVLDTWVCTVGVPAFGSAEKSAMPHACQGFSGNALNCSSRV